MADPLATVADLEARLGRPLTPEEAARANALLVDASALIRAYTGQDFTLTLDDEIVLRPVGTLLRLPQRPVLAVATVTAVGCDGLPDIPLSGWCFDGIDKIELWGLGGIVLNLPEVWYDQGPPDTYRAVYDHGYAEIPDDVIAVACAVVLRSLLTPSETPGMVSERIGQYSYQMQQGTGSTGVSARLSDADKQALARYRRKASTVAVQVH